MPTFSYPLPVSLSKDDHSFPLLLLSWFTMLPLFFPIKFMSFFFPFRLPFASGMMIAFLLSPPVAIFVPADTYPRCFSILLTFSGAINSFAGQAHHESLCCWLLLFLLDQSVKAFVHSQFICFCKIIPPFFRAFAPSLLFFLDYKCFRFFLPFLKARSGCF